jgi:hypothetical protein
MARKAKRREWTAGDVQDLKSFAKEESTCRTNCKITE